MIGPGFPMAIKLMAQKAPGIRVIPLECEYWMHQSGATA